MSRQQARNWRQTADATDRWCRAVAGMYERPVHEVRAWPLRAIHEEAARVLARQIVRDAYELKRMQGQARLTYRRAAKTDAYKALVVQYFNRHVNKAA